MLKITGLVALTFIVHKPNSNLCLKIISVSKEYMMPYNCEQMISIISS